MSKFLTVWFVLCSATAHSAPSCAHLFESFDPSLFLFTNMAERRSPFLRTDEHRVYRRSLDAYQVPNVGTADLEASFFALSDESATALSAMTPVEVAMDLTTAVFRNLPNLPQPSVKALTHSGLELKQSPFDTSEHFRRHEQIMEDLYLRFGRAREEIRSERSEYQRQDLSSIERTTHFVISSSTRALVHVQAQSSADPSEPFNVEHDLRVSIPRTKRAGFELGRARIITANAQQALPGMTPAESKRILPVFTYLRLLNWLNGDVGAGQAVIHADRGTRILFEAMISPIRFDETIPVSAKDGTTEWVLIAKESTLLAIEEKLMLEWIIFKTNFIKRSAPHPSDPMARNYVLSFRTNELPVLNRLGLVVGPEDSRGVDPTGADPKGALFKLTMPDDKSGHDLIMATTSEVFDSVIRFSRAVARHRFNLEI